MSSILQFSPFKRPHLPLPINWGSRQAQGLVALWPLGVYLNDSDPVGGFDLTPVNSPTFESDPEFGIVRAFDDASSQGLEYGAAILTAAPFTFVCWFKSDDLTLAQPLVGIHRSGSTTGQGYLVAHGATANDPIRLLYGNGLDTGATTGTNGFQANTWHHAAGISATATDHRVFLDGKRGTDGTTSRTFGAPIRTSIGKSFNVGLLSGLVAEARIYDRALDDEEVFELFNPETRWDLYAFEEALPWLDSLAAPGGHFSPLVNSQFLKSKLQGRAA